MSVHILISKRHVSSEDVRLLLGVAMGFSISEKRAIHRTERLAPRIVTSLPALMMASVSSLPVTRVAQRFNSRE